jgi:uncharacterized protein YecE (DUF72 family)
MRILAGTSGWSFKEWKGSFYPKGHPDDAMLTYYASRFPTVEVNNTFYRMPREKTMLEWAEQVPANFRFAIKASQRITHRSRLVDVASDVEYFTRICSGLGERRGPSLFQLPPNLKKDLPRLEAFLQVLPRKWQAAVEFRHPTWFDDSVYSALRQYDVAMCLAEQDDFETPTIATATWGYVRLHKLNYDQPALAAAAARIRALPWEETFVYFKHDDDDGSGPIAVDGFLREVQA